MHPFWIAFASLTSKERRVVSLRVRHGRTFEEVAREVGVTLDRAQTIEATALEKLRQRFDAGGIPLRDLLPG
jgi:DNA-directed RNA polymerase sigma subunit (sigma70/sigma32)